MMTPVSVDSPLRRSDLYRTPKTPATSSTVSWLGLCCFVYRCFFSIQQKYQGLCIKINASVHPTCFSEVNERKTHQSAIDFPVEMYTNSGKSRLCCLRSVRSAEPGLFCACFPLKLVQTLRFPFSHSAQFDSCTGDNSFES